jgi:DNA-binding CsgD family transcriptional regulator
MMRSVVIYGSSIAVAAFLLRWLEYRHAVRMFSTELYVVLVALLFTAIGIWIGHRLTRPTGRAPFSRNEKALQSLGISEREYEVLCLLAAGHTNREIADRLFVSPNTVKTHLTHLYEKLGVSRRTQAIHKCKALRLIA